MVNAFLEDADAYGYGMQFARILIISGPVLGILFVLVNTIQAMGAALPSLVLSVSRQGLVYLPVLTVFNQVFDTPKMLVMAQPVTDYMAVVLAAVLCAVAFHRHFDKK